jgi:FkbM family methyltransferase
MSKAIRTLLVRAGYLLISTGYKFSPGQTKLIEDFLARTYLRDVLKRFNINCVLDVGAQNGSFAKHLRWIGYDGHLLCFEPNPEEFRHLSKEFEADARWRGFNVALGSQNTTQSFNITSNSLLSSFMTPKNAKVNYTCEVEVKRLDSLFEDLIKHIPTPRIFMKIDTQGYDVEVIKGTGEHINNILVLQSEISVQPIYENIPHYIEALAFYESLGFQLMDLFTVLRDKKKGNNIIEYDCLMARLDRLEQPIVG